MAARLRCSAALAILAALCVLSVSGCGGAEVRKAKHLEKGQAYLAAGNLDKARVEFQNALQIAPKDAEARLEMGVVDEKRGNPREAAQFYQAVIEVSPDSAEARTRLARLYLFAAQTDLARAVIEPGIAKHPDDAGLLSVRAVIRGQQQDPSGALADAERALQLDPKNEDVVAVLASIYKSQNNLPKARILLEQSVQGNPTSVEFRLILAQIYAQEKRPADVESQLLKLVELKPGEKAHRVRLAQFYAQSDQIDVAERVLRQAIKDLPTQLDLKLSLIDFLAARRNRETAEKELDAMIGAAPEDDELKFALARLYQEGQEPAQAEQVYTGVIAGETLNQAGLTARDRLAALRLQQNDVAGALALTNEVLAKSPRDDDALMMRGTIALAQKDPRSAIADLRAVLRDQPNAVGVMRSLARAHLQNGEPAIAEETLRSAVEAKPNDTALRLDYAQLLAELGKTEQAKPILADVVKSHPDNMVALDSQFLVSMATKDLATAKADAEAMAAIRPKYATAYIYEGRVAEADKRTEDAIRFYATAAEVQPDALEPLQDEVRLLMAANRSDEAIKRLDDFSTRYPENPLGPDAKGELLFRSGKISSAQEQFKVAIARAPKWWIAYRDLAGAQLAGKEADAAVETLRKGISVVDDPDSLGLVLASVQQRLGQTDAAIAEYEDLLQRNPRSDVAANNLAMLLANFRKDPASLDRAKALTARFSESANPAFLDTYGWVLYKRGDAAASVPVLERVVAKAANDPVARYHLGMAQSQLGSSAAARDNLAFAVSTGSKFSGFDEAKATLDRLAKIPAAAPVPKT